MEARRCNIHGLVAASDGRCIICRRGNEADKDAPPPPTISVTTMIIAAGGVALAAVLGLWITRAPTTRALADKGGVVTPIVNATAEANGSPQDRDPPRRPTQQAGSNPTPAPTDSAALEVAQDTADPKLEQAKHQVAIKMYSTSTCPYCKRARAWMAKNGYRYTEFDIEKSETDAIEMRSLNPAATTPTFTLDGSPIAGFDAQSFDAALTRVAQARLR